LQVLQRDYKFVVGFLLATAKKPPGRKKQLHRAAGVSCWNITERKSGSVRMACVTEPYKTEIKVAVL
jgi:hypothetical protein